ncbi:MULTISPECIES: glycosyltransferase family 2 protein [unclassified Bradyrhizobium]|uniref:glycosyltransferase family 2 protein n=1 Tax=unclassified Bradyrhizobium TaxID=2631580 RepID=UPI00211E7FBF|nr:MULTISPECIES: glycosyltransferase family 2 protein [unclassified Bradyrhizobium]MDD1532482.1 glycosyltransferase family 2 protein [Bradyrhizobium sp. WBOS8]MDD1582486.1 glycosyltransferase family 2 protein [Bradyrhizobium sp. WBOS4]UUO50871.1 glycosyltransferase family 2 protein [Bradyrhizobium sp. WBOS04]UUO58250.1 glycosyltransferase family 2 protein [Bradyrhizobium sp. WBOS08]
MISIIVLTYNEERHLARALRSVAPIAHEVFIVDSFSSDRTLEIARDSGAHVYQHKFINQAKQFQWALDNLPISGTWVMRLDADEVVGADLAAEIRSQLQLVPAEVTGLTLRRRHIFLGRWIRHGGRYPLILLRIWRKGSARIEDRWMDEHIVLTSGRSQPLSGEFSDHSLLSISEFVEKHNRYATREAVDILNDRYGLFHSDNAIKPGNLSLQAAAKRFLKIRIYNALPFWISATLYFLYRYIIRLGFLDGTQGLIYHFLQGYWYRMLVGSKVFELEQRLLPVANRDEMLVRLETFTGLQLKGGN